MTPTAFVPPDPSTPGELGLPVPSYFTDESWRLGSALGWAGALAALLLGSGVAGAHGAGVGSLELLRTAYLLVLPALAATVLLSQGGIDFSVASVSGLSGAACAWLVSTQGASLAGGIAAGMALALMVGVVHAALVGGLRFPGFLVTLATMMAGRSLLLVATHGSALPLSAEGNHAPYPDPNLWGWGLAWAVLVAALLLVQFRPVQRGRPLSRVRQAVALGLPYVASSLIAGALGILMLLRYASISANFGTGLGEDGVAAAIVGATWLAGRRANVAGALMGALLLSALQSRLLVAGVDRVVVNGVKGAVFAAFLLLGYLFHRVLANRYAGRMAAVSAPPPRPGTPPA